jgi:hypothetical protein
LGHQQAGTVAGDVDNTAGKGTGEKLAVSSAYYIHSNGQVVDNAFRSTVFNAHERSGLWSYGFIRDEKTEAWVYDGPVFDMVPYSKIFI